MTCRFASCDATNHDTGIFFCFLRNFAFGNSGVCGLHKSLVLLAAIIKDDLFGQLSRLLVLQLSGIWRVIGVSLQIIIPDNLLQT